MENINKAKALEMALINIDKKFGKGSIMRLNNERTVMPHVSTGSLKLDIALGIGGVPKGRVIEIYGPESAGKSTLAEHIVAESQKLGGTCAYIDVENALDPGYAQSIGIVIEDLLLSQPDTGEQALDIVEALVNSNAVDVIVIDSVAALVPRAEIEGEMGDSHMGLQARLMSQALRKLTGSINKSQCVVIFINQLRDKIGVMFGSPETTTGGKALKFYASIRMDIRKIDTIKNGEDVIGNRVRVKVVKNKIAPPFKKAEFDILYGQGIDRVGEILDLGVELEIINKAGAWFSYGEVRLGQGKENSKTTLREDKIMLDEITRKIYVAKGLSLDSLPPLTAGAAVATVAATKEVKETKSTKESKKV